MVSHHLISKKYPLLSSFKINASFSPIFLGCETVPGDTCPPVTTPKPTDAPITTRSLTITGNGCTTCENQSCTVGFHTVKVEWQPPATSSPIQNYEIYWGKAQPFFPGFPDLVVFAGKTEIAPATATSYTLNVQPSMNPLGVMISAISSTSDPPRPLSRNYVFLDIPGIVYYLSFFLFFFIYIYIYL
ncbi:uncharacterized protein LOC130657569 isoform X1 [Hydractinia symbiolongicarpus]|uniref:uncharacterized protein LOC130657569 isoform X1 n=1 Tax=Hydractinia symbiolongicarpus TaxID=13093 RepID=UPI00254A4445|nr:uncharacterized protein LOC130657569 isoform X1 [Hydractinia symbiolongicarpus]